MAISFDEFLPGTPAATPQDTSPKKTASETVEPFDYILTIESQGNQFNKQGKPLTSKAGAVGISQVMPSTAKEAADLAEVPFDKTKFENDAGYNAQLGKAYFKKQLETFGDPDKAAAAYNAGPTAVKTALAKGANWLEHLPQETKDYVKKYRTLSGKQSVSFDGFNPSKKKAVSFDEYHPTDTIAEATPEQEGNTWTPSWEQMKHEGFAGRLITGMLDTTRKEKAHQAVIDQGVNPDSIEYQQKFKTEYDKLVTADELKTSQEKNPTVGESLKALGSEVINHPKSVAKSLTRMAIEDPELFLLTGGAGTAVKVGQEASKLAKAGQIALNVGKSAGKGAALGTGLETAAELGENKGLNLQRIANTGATFATLGAALHGVGEVAKATTGTKRVVTPEMDAEKVNNTLNEHVDELKTMNPEAPVAPEPLPEVNAKIDKEILDNPTLEAAGDIFKGKEDGNPIEAIKTTQRDLNFNDRAAKLWRASIEQAVPDERIRERMTMAIEADRPYDKLLTDAEKSQTISQLEKASERLQNKTDFLDETEQAAHIAKLQRLNYVIDKLKSLPSEEHAFPILKEVESKLASIGEKAKTEGLIDQLRQNYITHALNFSESSLNKEQIRTLMDRLFGEPKESRFVRDFTQHRIYRTIRDLEDRIREHGAEMGIDTSGVKVERDVAKIAEIYQKSMMTSVYQQRLLNYLEKQKTRGKLGEEIPLLTKDPEVAFKHNYEKFEGKGSEVLKNYAVHPDLIDPLKFIFRQKDPNLLLRALGSVSMLSKFLNTMGSLFHATSLFVARATSRPGDMLKEVFTAGGGTRMALHELEHNGASKAVELAIKTGLQIKTEDIQRGILNDVAATVDKILTEYTPLEEGTKILRRVTDPVEDLFLTKMNRFTWDYMHAGGKLHLWQQWFTKIKERNPELSDEEVGREVSSFVNNTLGGLDWLEVADQTKSKYLRAFAMKAANIQGRDWAQIALFAPDWTLSTLRSFTKALPAELMKPKNWQLREGAKGIFNPKNQGDLARKYVLNTAIAWLTILNGFNIAFTGRPIWTNKDPTRVDLGDGTSMQMAKHSMEAAEWLHDPEKTLGNKLGFWPKAVITMTTGKAYPSPNAPMLKDNTAIGRLRHSAANALPFQISAAVNAPPGERLKRAGASFIGVPIYGQSDKQHTSPEVRLERKLERKQTQRENKLEKMKRK